MHHRAAHLAGSTVTATNAFRLGNQHGLEFKTSVSSSCSRNRAGPADHAAQQAVPAGMSGSRYIPGADNVQVEADIPAPGGKAEPGPCRKLKKPQARADLTRNNINHPFPHHQFCFSSAIDSPHQ